MKLWSQPSPSDGIWKSFRSAAGTGVGEGCGSGGGMRFHDRPNRAGSSEPLETRFQSLTIARAAVDGLYAAEVVKRPVSWSNQNTACCGAWPARKMAERSLAERDTTRALGTAATSWSPRVGTRRLPGPGIVCGRKKVSRGRPWVRLNSVIASSLSNTTASPFGP